MYKLYTIKYNSIWDEYETSLTPNDLQKPDKHKIFDMP
jgi:hypothetical protein